MASQIGTENATQQGTLAHMSGRIPWNVAHERSCAWLGMPIPDAQAIPAPGQRSPFHT
jgi:hypothetical protein